MKFKDLTQTFKACHLMLNIFLKSYSNFSNSPLFIIMLNSVSTLQTNSSKLFEILVILGKSKLFLFYFFELDFGFREKNRMIRQIVQRQRLLKLNCMNLNLKL